MFEKSVHFCFQDGTVFEECTHAMRPGWDTLKAIIIRTLTNQSPNI
jgi:hypothetical protein